MREHNRDRLRRIQDEIGRQGWEIVLMTEIRADEKGVVWLGGDEERVAVIHSERAAIVLRGQALEEWIGEGRDGSFGGDEVGIGVPTHLGNR